LLAIIGATGSFPARPFGRMLAPFDIARAAESSASECVTGIVLDLERYPSGAFAELVKIDVITGGQKVLISALRTQEFGYRGMLLGRELTASAAGR
jgi:hypothetical protein